MVRNQSKEDYIEAILLIRKLHGSCRSVDVARHLGFSKPSVSIAVSKLIEEGYVIREDHGELVLTDKGMEEASEVLARHEFLKNFLIRIGVDEKTADQDACRMEHAFSDETFAKMKSFAEKEGLIVAAAE